MLDVYAYVNERLVSKLVGGIFNVCICPTRFDNRCSYSVRKRYVTELTDIIGTMSGDWQRLKRYNLPSGTGVGFSWESNKNDGAGSYIDGKKQLGHGHGKDRGSISRTTSNASSDPPQQSPLQHAGNNQDARFNFNNSPVRLSFLSYSRYQE